MDSTIYYQVIICPELDQTQVYLIDEKNIDEKILKRMLEENHGPPYWCTPDLVEKHEEKCRCSKIEKAIFNLYPDEEECELADCITTDGRKCQPYIISRTFVYYLHDDIECFS